MVQQMIIVNITVKTIRIALSNCSVLVLGMVMIAYLGMRLLRLVTGMIMETIMFTR